VGIVIIAIITVIPIITGASLTGIASLDFFERKLAKEIRPHKTRRSIFLTLAKPPVWSQGFCPAHRSGILFSIAE
jgi:hypothetical protein